MSSITELLQQISDPRLSLDERVRLRCELAKQFEKSGNYQAACRALGDLWAGFGKSPSLDLLDEPRRGEVLLRTGILTGWIGSMRLIKGSQQIARNLLAESIAIFESLTDFKKVAEAEIEIAYCCRREGALDEARRWYEKALSRLDDNDGDLKAVAVLRSAILELVASRLNDALHILEAEAPLFKASTNHAIRGSFHNQLAIVLRNLSIAENRQDYIERALREYAAASFHFELASHTRYRGAVENNLGMLLLQLGRFSEAHTHLDRAQALYTQLGDASHLAGVDETRARLFLAERKFAQAEKVALAAIHMFEKGDEHSLLAEALTTYGVVLVHQDRAEHARAAFERAMKVGEQAGDFEKAGCAALSLIELLAEELSDDELCAILEFARHHLRDIQNADSRDRLTECAYRVLSLIHTARPDWSNFSLDGALRRHEARFVQMALEDAGGSVTKAAELLGLPGHQSLTFILNRRHPHLLAARTPVKPRRRSIIKR